MLNQNADNLIQKTVQHSTNHAVSTSHRIRHQQMHHLQSLYCPRFHRNIYATITVYLHKSNIMPSRNLLTSFQITQHLPITDAKKCKRSSNKPYS